jgi:hypothetical protein
MSEYDRLFPIPAPAVHLTHAEGVWSCLPKGSPRIRLVFGLVGVVGGLAHSIYGSYHRQWLLASPMTYL